MKLNIRISGAPKELRKIIFNEEHKSIEDGIKIDSFIPEGESEWERQSRIEKENNKRYPRDLNFEQKLSLLDSKLKKISDPKEADILILKTLNNIEAEEDSQCRKQLFNYLKLQKV